MVVCLYREGYVPSTLQPIGTLPLDQVWRSVYTHTGYSMHDSMGYSLFVVCGLPNVGEPLSRRQTMLRSTTRVRRAPSAKCPRLFCWHFCRRGPPPHPFVASVCHPLTTRRVVFSRSWQGRSPGLRPSAGRCSCPPSGPGPSLPKQQQQKAPPSRADGGSAQRALCSHGGGGAARTRVRAWW